jgi:hypothetical protein
MTYSFLFILGFKLAMISPSDYYRDFYFYMFMNSIDENGLDDIPVEPPRNLSYFQTLNSSKSGSSTAKLPPSMASIKQYRIQHPKQNLQLHEWIEDHRILSKFSQTTTTCGKGFDFLQEEDLKGVLKHLPKGTMFDFDSFGRAARLKQNIEDHQGIKSPKRNRPYEKYEIEVQACAALLIKNQFTAVEFCGPNPYSEDLLNISEICDTNFKKYFTKRVNGHETSSIKLDKVYINKAGKKASQQIESKTKQEIIDLILSLENSLSEDEDVKNLKDLVKITHSKEYLINLYDELAEEALQDQLELDLE